MNSDTRIDQLKKWIKETLGVSKFTLDPVSSDASFRRYFRFKNGETQFIVVDAPPEKEKNSSFVSITHLLESEGLPVPHIYYSSLDFGFFLLDDFGDKLYLNLLNNNNADKLYKHALDALIIIQQTPTSSSAFPSPTTFEAPAPAACRPERSGGDPTGPCPGICCDTGGTVLRASARAPA